MRVFSLFSLKQTDETVYNILLELGMSAEDVSQIYTIFCKIDKDMSGEVNVSSILQSSSLRTFFLCISF